METTNNVDARLQQLSEQMDWLIHRQQKQEELWSELMPIGKEVVTKLSGRLEEAEKAGYLAFGQELLEVGKKVMSHYSPDDVRRLGDAIVTILDGVRALTQPQVMAIASDAAVALGQADQAEPVGFFGLVRATRNDDVQKGIAVLLEVVRKIGQGVEAMTEEHRHGVDRREKLARALGPRRGRGALGVERALPPPRTPVVEAPKAAAALCAVPKPAATALVVDGVGFSGDGYMTDATQWSKPIGESIATAQGITLTEAHWKVLEAARADYAQNNASPNIRRLTQIQPLSTKELYALFPRAPGRTIAKIAGLPKPAGCL